MTHPNCACRGNNPEYLFHRGDVCGPMEEAQGTSQFVSSPIGAPGEQRGRRHWVRTCPRCGWGEDTDGDGHCAVCARMTDEMIAARKSQEARSLPARGTSELYVPKAQYEQMKARLEAQLSRQESAEDAWKRGQEAICKVIATIEFDDDTYEELEADKAAPILAAHPARQGGTVSDFLCKNCRLPMKAKWDERLGYVPEHYDSPDCPEAGI